MIPLDQIEHVKQESDIKAVVEGLGVELRRQSSGWVGRCPFHNEKTGSFYVNVRTNRYKCFGCGEGGNAIDFVMKRNGVDFIEAVRYVADTMGYTLTDDYHETEEQKMIRERKMAQVEVNKLAMQWFSEQLKANKEASDYVYKRGWNDETLRQFELGYAPDDWQALYDWLHKTKKVSYDTLAKSSLFAKNKKGGYYCKFRDRIMFPIFDASGDVVAFSGRLVPWHVIEDGRKDPKYVNSSGNEEDAANIYVKGRTLYGWSFARPEAVRLDEAIIVEGNPDVIKMHQIGVRNVVAACGTALTIEQCEMLAKKVKRVVMLYDNDDAGQSKMESNGRILLKAGVMAYTLTIPVGEDGEKQDPDTFFYSKEQFEEFAKENKKSWFCYVAERKRRLMGDNPDPLEVTVVAAELAEMLLLREESERIGHIDQLAKIIPPKKSWNTAIKNAEKNNVRKVNEQGYSADQVAMINEYRFCEVNHCYRMQRNMDGGYTEVSNFTLRPLFHIESTVNAKRLYQLTNNKGITKNLEIAQKDLVSLSAFKTKVESFGNFLFTGTDSDLSVIKAYLYEHTKTCREVEQLGWQREGFWAWSNGVLDEQSEFITLDELGTVEIGKQWYYLPALSSFFKSDTQLFQYERRFVHTDSSADLRTLSEKMLKVYGDNAIVSIGFYLATLFRDMIFQRFNSFPILNIFGQKGTGKTAMAITLLKLFGNHGDGLNMANSTLPAMADHVSHCRNALVHIDEYKNSVEYGMIDFLKGIYDGRGRSRMNMDRDKKKEMTPVDCGVILTGQEMTTADNALFSRVLFLTVSRMVFSAEQNAAYEDLKAYEKRGLTTITNDLLSLRSFVMENYEKQLNIVKEELRQACSDYRHIEGRILQNWTMVLTILRTLRTQLDLPFSYEEAMDVFVKDMENQNSAVKSSNEIANFWRGVESMLTNGDIEEGYDIKLKFNTTNIRCGKGSGKSRLDMEYTMTMDVLYLNPSRVFNLYAKLMKSTKDNKSSIMNEESLRHYLQTQDEFMGDVTKQFKVPTRIRQNPQGGMSFSETGKEITSLHKSCRAMVFNYAKLTENYGIDLNVQSTMDEDVAESTEIPY